MAKGYWGPPTMGCICCHSGPKEKFWCETCDHVCKAPNGWTPKCPTCGVKMLNMGHRWRPGPKGDRFRHYPEGYRVSVRAADSGGYPPLFETRVFGARGYHPQQAERPAWRPSGTKLRAGGKIRSWRLP